MKKLKNLLHRIANIKFIAAIRRWTAKHRKLSIAIYVILAILIGALVTFLVFSNRTSLTTSKTSTSKKVAVKKPDPIKYYSQLTGLEVINEAAITAPVNGVMIPNDTYGARPQAGLKDAGIVFEAICEGGITRFLALYQNNKPALIGPIRSVRMYYISWVAPFNAGIVHYGGNMDAIAEIRSGNYRDMDQMLDNGASWRRDDRDNPDDAFTSGALLEAQNTAKGYITSEFIGFKRKDIPKPTTTASTTTETTTTTTSTFPAATNISIHISESDFDSSYIYNAATNTYARSQAGTPHLEEDGTQIAPSVVIAMHVEEYSSSDPENHEVITTVGSGAATIFQDGVAIEGTWTKPSQFENIKFTDATGVEIPLVRGQTWIAAVPNAYGTVTYN